MPNTSTGPTKVCHACDEGTKRLLTPRLPAEESTRAFVFRGFPPSTAVDWDVKTAFFREPQTSEKSLRGHWSIIAWIRSSRGRVRIFLFFSRRAEDLKCRTWSPKLSLRTGTRSSSRRRRNSPQRDHRVPARVRVASSIDDVESAVSVADEEDSHGRFSGSFSSCLDIFRARRNLDRSQKGHPRGDDVGVDDNLHRPERTASIAAVTSARFIPACCAWRRASPTRCRQTRTSAAVRSSRII